MKIAIVTLEGFNELDSFVALAILNRAKADGVHAEIVGTGDTVTSMNGVSVSVQRPLSFAQEADAVTKLFAAGLLPQAFALKRLGYSDDDIAEIRTARRAEALDVAGINFAQLVTGGAA